MADFEGCKWQGSRGSGFPCCRKLAPGLGTSSRESAKSPPRWLLRLAQPLGRSNTNVRCRRGAERAEAYPNDGRKAGPGTSGKSTLTVPTSLLTWGSHQRSGASSTWQPTPLRPFTRAVSASLGMLPMYADFHVAGGGATSRLQQLTSPKASTPHHGAGAGFGIEDCAILSALLADERVEDASHLEAVFATFDAARRERDQWLVESSREAADSMPHRW